MWLDWLLFCDCGFMLSALWYPLSAPTFLLGFLWPWTWHISSSPLAAPVPGSHHSAAPVPGIKISGRNINNLRCANDTTLTAESEEGLKSLLMKVKEDSEKVDLKLNIQKTTIMASGPITSRQIDGETVEDFILGSSKITEDGDCSHEIKRCTCSLEENLWPT